VAEHLHQVLKNADVPTKDVTVEVLDDKVRLRGQVRSVDEMSKVLAVVGAESGNRQVESFLHLPSEPAPNKQPARSARN
jgi:osmotically-inducible protein OsmY